eukprot:gene1934-1173_t
MLNPWYTRECRSTDSEATFGDELLSQQREWNIRIKNITLRVENETRGEIDDHRPPWVVVWVEQSNEQHQTPPPTTRAPPTRTIDKVDDRTFANGPQTISVWVRCGE